MAHPQLWGSDPLSLQERNKKFGKMLKSLPRKALLPASPLLKLTGVVQSDSSWIVMADGLDPGACPKCKGISVSRHSYYIRTLQDLPAFGAAVTLKSQTLLAIHLK